MDDNCYTPDLDRQGSWPSIMVFDADYPPDEWHRWFVLDCIDIRHCDDHHVMPIGLRITSRNAVLGCLNCGVRYEKRII
jgi:hypothetical protein